MLIFSLLESDDEGGNNSIDMTVLSIVITLLILGLLIVIIISATIIVCFYQRKKNVFTENLSHIYDVPDYAKLSKIELKVKDRSDGSQQVSCETEANVAYGHSCDGETNIAYGLGGCSVPQPQTFNVETIADTEEYTEMNPQ